MRAILEKLADAVPSVGSGHSAIPMPIELDSIGVDNLTLFDQFVGRLAKEELISGEILLYYEAHKGSLEAVEAVLASFVEKDSAGVRCAAAPHLQVVGAPTHLFPNATQSPFRLDNFMLILGHEQAHVGEYLRVSFKNGFRIEMEELRPAATYANPPLQSAEAEAWLRDSVAVDLENGHIGRRPPGMVNFVQNPIRAEPKRKDGRKVDHKFRRVHNLSKEANGTQSVNSAILKENSTLEYETVQDLEDDIMELFSEGAADVGINSEDLRNAYRNIPLHPECWSQLGFGLDGAEYCELFLPFGVSSAPRIFSCLSATIRWLLKHTLQLRHVRSYIDDFANAAEMGRAAISSRIMRLTFKLLGLEDSPEKSVCCQPSAVFLGVGLDTCNRVRFMTRARQDNLLEDVTAWSLKSAASLNEIQSLCGHLMHATKMIPQGRLFTRRLFAKTRWHEVGARYRPSKKIAIDCEFKKDLRWFQSFLAVWNGKMKMRASNEPTLEVHVVQRTDASDKAAAGVVGLEYFQVSWEGAAAYMSKFLTNINERELFAVVTCALTHGPTWAGKRVKFLVDNRTDVDAMRKSNSKSKVNLHLLRVLHFTAAICDFEWTPEHLPGALNEHADAASRLSIGEFEAKYPQFKRIEPTLPPHHDDADWEACAAESLLARLRARA